MHSSVSALKHILFLLTLTSISAAYMHRQKLQAPLGQPSIQPQAPSRENVVRSSSKSVTGPYALYDLLSIWTQSGSISVQVTPHSASPNDPSQAATLQLKSHSGSVWASLAEALISQHVDVDAASDPPPSYSSVMNEDKDLKSGSYAEPETTLEQRRGDGIASAVTQTGFPSREYITTVSTQSGAISGTYPLGARTELESQSGSYSNVELVVMPWSSSGSRQLSTASHSGSQNVRIVDKHFSSGEEKDAWWVGMLSKHESQSGSVNVDYPESWEGTIQVETGSGSVKVKGRGVEIIREEKGKVVARKGKEGGGSVIVKTGSGKVDLRFG